MKIIFIIGGARSGKSAFALNEAAKTEGRKAFIATAQALDGEMKERIRKHREERGHDWDTYEEPVNIADTLSNLGSNYNIVLLDCLTLWLSNIMHHSAQPETSINHFLEILSSGSNRSSSSSRSNRLNGLNGLSGLNLFLVANEVGMGIVPENELARRFRDLAGSLNQKLAAISDEVYLVTAGIPIKIK